MSLKSDWIQTPLRIAFEQSPNQKGLVFFTVSFNGSVWGTGVPVSEKVEGSDLKTPLKSEISKQLNAQLKEISDNFEKAFGQAPSFRAFREIQKQSNQAPLDAYLNLYGNPENMEGYMDGKPRDPEKVVGTYMRDIVRWGPIDGVENLSYDTATPWSGIVGYAPSTETNSSITLGRAANGGGRVDGYSESGLFLSKECRGKGFGRDGTIALLVHAWLFSKLGFPVNGKPIKCISATASPDNKGTLGLIQRINKAFNREVVTNQNLGPDFQPYGQEVPRNLYTIKVDDIEDVLGLFVPQNKMTINGKPVPDFLKSEGAACRTVQMRKIQPNGSYFNRTTLTVVTVAVGVLAIGMALWTKTVGFGEK